MKILPKTLGVMIAMITSIMMLNIELTAMYVILEPIRGSIPMSFNQLPWVITSYMLLFGSVMAIAGKLGDVYGHRTILVIGLILFGLTSLTGGMASAVTVLLVARALQGLSAALIFPMATAIAFNVIPKQHKGLGIGLVTSAIGFSLAAGPLFGGVLADFLNWRWVFFINIPLVMLSLLLTFKYVEKSAVIKTSRVDFVGGLMLVLLMGSLIIGFNQLQPHAIWHHDAGLFFAVSVIMTVLFYSYEKQVSAPIIPVVLLRNKRYLSSCLLRVLTIMPFYIILLIFGQYSQINLHMDSVHASLMLLPMTITIGLLSVFAGKLIDRWGARLAMLLATTCYIISFAVLAGDMVHMHTISLAMILIIPGVAFSFASPGALAIGMQATSAKVRGSATAVFYMISVFSGLIGITFSTGVMSYFQVNSLISSHAITVVMMTAVLISIVAFAISYRLPKQN